jgi:uncharacterized UPF0160 family protein
MAELTGSIDNGINIAAETAYSQQTDLSARVRRLNPRWNEPATDSVYDVSHSLSFLSDPLTGEQEKFAVASKITGEEFLNQLDEFAEAWLPARDIVQASLDNRFEVDKSGSVLVFNQAVPWKDHLFSIEPTLQPASTILYVLYPESEAPGAKWRIQCVPESTTSFVNRKSMPEAWCGVRDAELSKASGIEGCTFCHASGFTGGNETYEGVLEMARKAA